MKVRPPRTPRQRAQRMADAACLLAGAGLLFGITGHGLLLAVAASAAACLSTTALIILFRETDR